MVRGYEESGKVAGHLARNAHIGRDPKVALLMIAHPYLTAGVITLAAFIVWNIYKNG
jgi:hypothetical protein